MTFESNGEKVVEITLTHVHTVAADVVFCYAVFMKKKIYMKFAYQNIVSPFKFKCWLTKFTMEKAFNLHVSARIAMNLWHISTAEASL